MRRVWVLVAVLVLGAWTCAPPSGGGDDVAGMSTAGYAAVAAGEDWHYVGEAGEPAFQGSWANHGFGTARLAFRIREAGIVDIQGVVTTSGTAGTTIFTLPSEYRPSTSVIAPGVGLVAGDHVAAIQGAGSSGNVSVLGSPANPTQCWIYMQVFLDPPET